MPESQHRPLVSVIIPVKNGERFLAAAIHSVLAQEYPFREIIVVDGQSIDRTAYIAQSFDAIRYIYQDCDPGLACARNLGLQASHGDLIAILSHDDLWSPKKLSTQVDYMLRHPEVQITITRVKYFLEPGCPIPAGFAPHLLASDHAGPMPETFLVRRDVFDSIGVFNPECGHMEDLDWFARARDGNIRMALIDEVLLYKRIHENNISYGGSKLTRIRHDVMIVLKHSLNRKRALESRTQ